MMVAKQLVEESEVRAGHSSLSSLTGTGELRSFSTGNWQFWFSSSPGPDLSVLELRSRKVQSLELILQTVPGHAWKGGLGHGLCVTDMVHMLEQSSPRK